MIDYQEYEPDKGLEPYVKSYWFFTIDTYDKKAIEILPDGCFDLVVTIKSNKIVKTFITGIWRKSITVYYNEPTKVFGVRFKPFALGTLLDIHINDLINTSQNIVLKDCNIDGKLILDCFDAYKEQIVEQINAVFISNNSKAREDIRLKNCFDLITKSSGTFSIELVANKTGISARQLRRKVNNMLGLGLKDYAKIIRFKDSLKKVKYDSSNYKHHYDQSHFIRDAKQFTGRTPEKLKLGKNDRFIQYFDFKAD